MNEKRIEFTTKVYKNAIVARAKNRRISLYKRADGGCDVSLVTIDGNNESRCESIPIRNCGVNTLFGLSPASLEILAYVMAQFINEKYHCPSDKI